MIPFSGLPKPREPGTKHTRTSKYPQETRLLARSLYVNQRLSIEQIAARLQVVRATVQNWRAKALREGDDWDATRTATLLGEKGYAYAISQAVEDYLMAHTSTLKALREDPTLTAERRAKILSQLAFAMDKVRRSAIVLNPELNKLSVAIDLLARLVEFVQERYPQRAPDLLEVLEPFGHEMAKHYG
jgi:transposase-like protein